MTAVQHGKRPQSVPNMIEPADPVRTMHPAQKVAHGATGGAGLASGEQLRMLADYLDKITDAATTTGWHSPNMLVSFGDDEESIVVGVRWIRTAYYAEIR